MKTISSIGMLILSVGIFFLYVKPEWAHISNLRAQSTEYASALQTAQQAQSLHDSLSTAYASVSDSDKAKLDRMIPDTFSAVKLASDLSAEAGRYGLTVASFSADNIDESNLANPNVPGPRDLSALTGPSGPYQKHKVSLTLSGTYVNFVNFLKVLETNDQLVDVSGISISGSSQQQGQLTIKVEMTTYSLK